MVTIPALVLLTPVFAILALLVRLKLGSPVIFRHVRPGFRSEPFTLYKFRSMTNARDREGHLLSDGERLTPFGKRLRSTSLDELPELFNVLTGDMSLVGPRPLVMHYLDLYSPEQARRHDALPGITGLAQVHGRNNVPWERRFALDVFYVDHQSLWFDLKILLLTVWKVLSREGINQEGEATVEGFKGNQPLTPPPAPSTKEQR